MNENTNQDFQDPMVNNFNNANMNHQSQAVNQQSYQQPVYANMQPAPMMPPETTKNRSAYIAALLHIVFGTLGLGYYYRGMKDKAEQMWICLIVGTVTSCLFGLGMIIISVCQIINIVEAIKLFKGDIQTDAYGRKLYLEF